MGFNVLGMKWCMLLCFLGSGGWNSVFGKWQLDFLLIHAELLLICGKWIFYNGFCNYFVLGGIYQTTFSWILWWICDVGDYWYHVVGSMNLIVELWKLDCWFSKLPTYYLQMFCREWWFNFPKENEWNLIEEIKSK